jgi:DNA anti-recombination protein RmuC
MPEQFNKKDLEIILEVNKKAVEIETTVADQNEEIIALLTANKTLTEKMDEKIDELVDRKLNKLIEQSEETSKDLFKMRVLFITGILALIGQILEIFFKK